MMHGILTSNNYTQGFLIDQELMGGVSEDPEKPGTYTAYVLNHVTSQYLGYETGLTLDAALELINQVKREWGYERAEACRGEHCGNTSCQSTSCLTSSCES